MRVVQAGGVKLDELHVGDSAAGAPGHRDTVARGRVRVAGVAIHLARSAAGEDDGGGRQRLDPAALGVERVDAEALRLRAVRHVPGGDQIDRHPALAQPDVAMRTRPRKQRIVNRLSGRVRGVRDTPHRVSALAGQVQAQRSLRIGREFDTKLHQPLDRRCASARDCARRRHVDQARSGLARVAQMRLDAVVAAEHADDAALGPGGRALLERALRQHRDRRMLGQL